jgi:hypothetical protein
MRPPIHLTSFTCALAVSLAAVAVIPVALSAADEGGRGEGERDGAGAESGPAWAAEPRHVAAWPDGSGFLVQSTRDSDLGKDALVAAYDAEAAQLTISLDAQRPEDGRLASALTVLAVSEFRDEDGDGRQDLGEPVVRRIEVPGTPATSGVQGLADGGWRAFAVHQLPAATPTAPAGSPAAGPGRLEVHVDARPAASDGTTPATFGLRMVLDGVQAGNGTHLAIEASVDAMQAHDAVNADLARQRDGEYVLATRWDGGEGDVVEGSDPLHVTFVRSMPAAATTAYEAEVDARWQPASAGFLEEVGARGSLPLYVGAAFVTLAALAVPAWRRLRR